MHVMTIDVDKDRKCTVVGQVTVDKRNSQPSSARRIRLHNVSRRIVKVSMPDICNRAVFTQPDKLRGTRKLRPGHHFEISVRKHIGLEDKNSGAPPDQRRVGIRLKFDPPACTPPPQRADIIVEC